MTMDTDDDMSPLKLNLYTQEAAQRPKQETSKEIPNKDIKDDVSESQSDAPTNIELIK